MEPAWVDGVLIIVATGITVIAGVVLLRLFFDARAHLKRRWFERDACFKMLPGLNPHGCMQVRLKEGKTFSGLRLVGVMDADAARAAGLPHPLTQLVCFEREDGARVWIDAAAIRVIETLPEGTA